MIHGRTLRTCPHDVFDKAWRAVPMHWNRRPRYTRYRTSMAGKETAMLELEFLEKLARGSRRGIVPAIGVVWFVMCGIGVVVSFFGKPGPSAHAALGGVWGLLLVLSLLMSWALCGKEGIKATFERYLTHNIMGHWAVFFLRDGKLALEIIPRSQKELDFIGADQFCLYVKLGGWGGKRIQLMEKFASGKVQEFPAGLSFKLLGSNDLGVTESVRLHSGVDIELQMVYTLKEFLRVVSIKCWSPWRLPRMLLEMDSKLTEVNAQRASIKTALTEIDDLVDAAESSSRLKAVFLKTKEGQKFREQLQLTSNKLRKLAYTLL